MNAPILSRPLVAETVHEDGVTMSIDASRAECEALRQVYGLIELKRLQATFAVRREGGSGLRVAGEVTADIVQTCVVSLDPFDTRVCEPVSVHYLVPDALERWRKERDAEPADPRGTDLEEPDVIEGGTIDLGLLAAEHLALGLDPYPKKPGIRFEDVAPAGPAEASPFAVLKALRPDDA